MTHPLSYKDCTGWNLNDHPELAASLVPGSIVEKTCFSQETPDSPIFPTKMKGVTFKDCNLDNCDIPDGNVVEGGSQRRFKVQNDLRDWQLNDNDEPVALVNEKTWKNLQTSVDPADIPDVFIRKETLPKAQLEKDIKTPEFQSWFTGDVAIVAEGTQTIDTDVTVEAYEAMIANGEFLHYDDAPTATKFIGPDKQTYIRLTGPVTYVQIEGEGKFSGGIGGRPFGNDIVQDAPPDKSLSQDVIDAKKAAQLEAQGLALVEAKPVDIPDLDKDGKVIEPDPIDPGDQTNKDPVKDPGKDAGDLEAAADAAALEAEKK